MSRHNEDNPVEVDTQHPRQQTVKEAVRIEGIGVLHRFHHNDLLLNPRVAPWGPFPGADSIHAVALFAPPERGAVLVYAQSPPEGATSHRGVALHPPGWRRKRNILKGATWLVRPTARAAVILPAITLPPRGRCASTTCRPRASTAPRTASWR